MIDEIIKTLDLIKGLSKNRADKRRLIYNEFAKPAFSQFDHVHELYMHDLAGYLDLVGCSVDPRAAGAAIREATENDSREARKLKKRVLALQEMSEDPDLGALAKVIIAYFGISPRDDVSLEFGDASGNTGSVRQTISREIKRACRELNFPDDLLGTGSSHDLKSEIIKIIKRNSDLISESYGRVAAEFTKVKIKLLKPS